MFTYTKKVFFLILIILLLSGCMYPKSELAQNQVPNEAQMEMVQSAVLQYQEQTNGLLPIKTKPAETPIFEKYLIDFSLLRERGILTEIPGSAFENGGYYQYVIITPEEDPRVRVIDLRATEALRQIVVKLDIYRSQNTYPPFGQELISGVHRVNEELLKLDSYPYVTSPFSQENLPIIMDTNGDLYIDYSIDLQKAINEFDHSFQPGDDIRMIIAENTPFVPAYSLPYTIDENGDVIFLKE